MIYDYSVYDRQGKEIPLANYKGQVLLIVNTATACGFTPQYKELQRLYDTYHDKGLTILDIPCNQFKEQAPESDDDIHQFCQLHYKTGFDQLKKSNVTGENALPLYDYLTKEKGFQGFGTSVKGLAMATFLKTIDKDYAKTDSIKWNFTKFLVDRKGHVLARFEPTISIKTIERVIKEVI